MSEAYQFLAGPGRVLILDGQNIIGVAKTMTETTFDMSITAEDVRGGAGNMLFGRYFHDSNMAITLVDAMFNIHYVAAALGTTVESGGISLYESAAAGETVTVAGQLTLTNTPVAYDGAMIGWYKKPSDPMWQVATISGTTMTIPNAQINDVYCVKYFYHNENAKSITIKAQYVPRTLHIVIINDLYSGDAANVAGATRYGRLITDIPRFQLNGSQNLNLTATSAATVSLDGSALAYDTSDSCEEDLVYGTMTQEIYNTVWQDEVVALAIANGTEIQMGASDSYTMNVYAIFGNGTLPALKANSNFTFAVETTPESTITSGIQVGTNTGVITTTSATAGTAVISVSLTGHDNVPPVLATVTVTV